MRTKYVMGFAFTPDHEHVLLIEKTHPEWMKGRWCGIGGHIEDNETPIEAMSREGAEEAMTSSSFQWEHYATLQGEDFEVFVFAGIIRERPTFKSDSGEVLRIWRLPLSDIPKIGNTDFLIEAALVRNSFKHITVTYGLNGDSMQVK